MVRLVFSKDPQALAKNAKTVLVIGAAAALREPGFGARLFSPKVRRLVVELAGETKPGDMGASAATLTGSEPRRVIVGVLPDKVSRYNAEARPESIARLVASSGIQREDRAAVILVLDRPEHLPPALNALGRAFPLFSAKTDDSERQDAKIGVAAVDRSGRLVEITPFARELVAAAREAAALVDTPPSALDPEAFGHAIRILLGERERVRIEEIVGDDLLAARLGGIHAVGRAATKAPRLLVATYEPEGATRHVALVGKGVTFDTGGLHLKGRGMMETMKSDMGGAAAVAGAFRVLTALGPDLKITLILCIAENAIGPEALKPDDVLTQHSGKTVEINNTDAEGRILLADGVSYAARTLGAEIVLDAATLTGAQLVATGVVHAAIISNDAELEQLVIESGYDTGDLVHPLPFAPELFKGEFKSAVADMRNSVKDRSNAQTSCAAQFIYNHLDGTDVRWCHVDLAGPAFRSDRATGFGVALLADTVLRITRGELDGDDA